MIYEQATSNKQGEGDAPSPIKPKEAEGGKERSQRERQRFREGATGRKEEKFKGSWGQMSQSGYDLNERGK